MDRIYYAKNKNYQCLIRSNGKEYNVQFVHENEQTTYTAKTADESVLGVDENPLLLNHAGYGVDYFSKSDWLLKAKAAASPEFKQILASAVSERDNEIAELKRKLAIKNNPKPIKETIDPKQKTNLPNELEDLKAKAKDKSKGRK